MNNFGRREIFYAVFIICAVWFVVLWVVLEKCEDGLSSDKSNQNYKKAFAAKEKEIAFLRSQIGALDLQHHVSGLPTIYVITPTYARPVQKAELTRLKHVFQLVPNVHWILVEDSEKKTPLVTNFLKNIKFNTTQLLSITPPEVKLKEKDPNWLKPRGVLQRNTGLDWLRRNLNVDFNRGVVFFADDDNTYSEELFKEMRDTKLVSVWPVGLVGKLRYEAPIVKDGKVVDWHTYWYRGQRAFGMDMAGFAVNLKLILENPQAQFDINAARGFQESVFLQSLGITLDDLEPKADMCTKVLVWHTRTSPAELKNEEKMLSKNLEQSDPDIEV